MAHPKTPKKVDAWNVYDVVYRDRIIYVGCTKRLRQRIERNIADGRFPADVDVLIAGTYRTQNKARQAETARLQAFRPLLNVQHVQASGRGEVKHYLW